MATGRRKLHGRVEGREGALRGARLRRAGRVSRRRSQPANFDGPGQLALPVPRPCPRAQCALQFFDGMSPDEIAAAQSPIAGWERPTPRLRARPAPIRRRRGATSPTRSTPSRRASGPTRGSRRPSRFTAAERRALAVLGLGEDADRHALRSAIRSSSAAITPTATAATAATRQRLGEVIEAYQLLRKSRGFRLMSHFAFLANSSSAAETESTSSSRAYRPLTATWAAAVRPSAAGSSGRAVARPRTAARR